MVLNLKLLKDKQQNQLSHKEVLSVQNEEKLSQNINMKMLLNYGPELRQHENR